MPLRRERREAQRLLVRRGRTRFRHARVDVELVRARAGRHAGIGHGVARREEEAAERAVVRLDVEHLRPRAPTSPNAVTRPRRQVTSTAALVARTADQRVADRERRRRGRRDVRPPRGPRCRGTCSSRGRAMPAAEPRVGRQLDAARPRVRDVVGLVAAGVRERAPDGHDQIVVAVEERRRVERVRAAARTAARRRASTLRLRSGFRFGLSVKAISNASGGRMPVPALAWMRVEAVASVPASEVAGRHLRVQRGDRLRSANAGRGE